MKRQVSGRKAKDVSSEDTEELYRSWFKTLTLYSTCKKLISRCGFYACIEKPLEGSGCKRDKVISTFFKI